MWLLNTLTEIQGFRDQLYGNALAELAARVPTQPAAVQERLHWIVEANEVWRDLLSFADRSADHEKGAGGSLLRKSVRVMKAGPRSLRFARSAAATFGNIS